MASKTDSPARCSCFTVASASTNPAPRATKRCDTELLPDPMPPVRPNSYMVRRYRSPSPRLGSASSDLSVKSLLTEHPVRRNWSFLLDCPKDRGQMDDLLLMPVSLLLIDDHRMVRESLKRSYLEWGFDVVADVGSGEEAVPLAVAQKPQLVVTDIAMPGMDGIEACEQITQQSPDTRVIILTMHGDEDSLARAIRAGASGFLLKDCSIDELMTATRLAASGETVIAPQLKPHLLAQVRRPTTTIANQMTTQHRVTPRETEVLQMIADGYSTPEVAEKLFISQKTVKNHLASIYQKLDARDRTQAVLTSVRLGIVTLD